MMQVRVLYVLPRPFENLLQLNGCMKQTRKIERFSTEIKGRLHGSTYAPPLPSQTYNTPPSPLIQLLLA
jgi:hypothetical protein